MSQKSPRQIQELLFCDFYDFFIIFVVIIENANIHQPLFFTKQTTEKLVDNPLFY